MSNTQFDAEAFYAALDATRHARKLTWKKVAEKSGVSASTLTRMGQGKRPDVDGLAALAEWSGLDVRKFYRSPEQRETTSEPLAEISALLRADKNLEGESAQMLEKMLSAAYSAMRKPDD